MTLTFLDLFAGAGGLSEGFIRAGFSPIAHVEMDRAACYTLKTRMAYHCLKRQNRNDEYDMYLRGDLTRSQFYNLLPDPVKDSVINVEISKESLSNVFAQIDGLLGECKLDLIVGGPPCQTYSLVGRNRLKEARHNDKRNHLYVHYAEFLKRYRPRFFVFENVIGLLTAKGEDGASYFDSMRTLFRGAGYETEYKVLSADDYGVLQHRRRIILVGREGKETGFYPEPVKWQPDVKVGDALSDLPWLRAGEGTFRPCELSKYSGRYLDDSGIRNKECPTAVSWHWARPHNDRDLEIYRIAVTNWNEKQTRIDYNHLPDHLKTHKNRSSFLDRFKVVAADLPFCQTVVSHISQDGHYYIHPDIEQNRSLTPREAARLQTFPDDYYFESTTEVPGRTPAFRQIGNAVPVLLSERIASKLMEVW